MKISVSPKDGGCITALHCAARGTWQPILLGAEESDVGPAALASGLLAMLPFANRASRNRLVSADQTHLLPPNTPEPLALHGTGWEHPWQVLDRSAQALRLGLKVGRASYPFAFSAVLTFACRATGSGWGAA